MSSIFSKTFETYLDVSDRATLYLDPDDKIAWANRACTEIFGMAVDDLMGRPIEHLSKNPIDRSVLRPQTSIYQMRHATGLLRDVLVTTVNLGDHGWMLELRTSSIDQFTSEAGVYEKRLRALSDEVPVGIFFSEVGLRLYYINTRLTEIFEVPAGRIYGIGWLDFFSAEDRSKVEGAATRALKGERSYVVANLNTGTGRIAQVSLNFRNISTDRGATGFVGTIDDVTDQIAAEERLTFAATHDPLTGLPNREAMDLTLARHFSTAGREGSSLMMAFCDLDDFKTVNDTLGHVAGDRLLIEIAKRLQRICTEDQQVFRYAGDEFIVLCRGVSTDAQAKKVIRGFQRCLELPIYLASTQIQISASFGYAVFRSKVDIEEMITKVDREMYKNKAAKKDLIFQRPGPEL